MDLRRIVQRGGLVAVAAMVVALVAPGLARATTYCVGAPAGCTGTAEAGTASGLTAALSAVSSSGGTVDIAAGTYTSSDGYYVSAPSADQPVTIVGQGMANTSLGSTSSVNDVLDTSGAVTVHDLWIIDDGGQYTNGLVLDDANALAYNVRVECVGTVDAAPLSIAHGATVRDSVVQTNGMALDAIGVQGSVGTIENTTITDLDNEGAIGVEPETSTGTDTITLSHDRIVGYQDGINDALGTLDVSDTLIDLGNISGARGAILDNSNNAPAVLGLHTDGVTIVGSGANQAGVFVHSQSGGAGAQTLSGNIVNTAFDLTGTNPTAVSVGDWTGSTFSVTLDHDAFPAGDLSLDSGGSWASYTPTETGLLDTTGDTLAFVDAANGDYTPAAGSPLIDAGPAVAADDCTATDLAGNSRAAGAALDIGAFEAQTGTSATCAPPPSPPGGGAGTGGGGTDTGGGTGTGGGAGTGTTGGSVTTTAPVAAKVVLVKAFKLLHATIHRTRGAAWKLITGKKLASRSVVVVTTTRASTLTITCAVRHGHGWKALKGHVSIKVRKGVSYLGFAGTWQHKLLARGTYRVTIVASASGVPRQTAHHLTLHLT